MVMADCPYTKIAVMQLFYELKQKFPTIPDQVVTDLIRQESYNREGCEKRLAKEYERHRLHSYPVDIVDKMTEGKERPKTLPLPSNETNPVDLFKGRRRTVCVEEQQRKPGHESSSPKEGRRTSCICDKTAVYDTKRQCDIVPDVRDSVQNIEICNNQQDVFVSDLELHVQNDKCGCGQTCLQVRYKNKGSQSAPTTPSSMQKSIEGNAVQCNGRKYRSTLNVDPSLRSPCNSLEAQKPVTKVMLTLRPPSTEPLPSVNLIAKGSHLTYSTQSFDPERGYESQLQISISEGGNTTLSASRIKSNRNIPEKKPNGVVVKETFPSLSPAFEKALSSTSELRLREQEERKRKLKAEFDSDKEKLIEMQREVQAMEKDLEARRRAPFVSEKLLRLRAEVASLQEQCQLLQREIMLSGQPIVPTPMAAVANNNDTANNWTCGMCTFKNHPMLPKCEQCEMARVDLRDVLSNIYRPTTTSPQLPAIH